MRAACGALAAAALCVALWAVCVAAGPQLVARKHVTDEHVVEGRNFTVDVTVWNVGDSAAFNVNISDAWPDVFVLREGAPSVVVDKIEASNKHTLKLVLEPTRHGEYRPTPAVVTYAEEADGEVDYTLYTSTQPIVRIFELDAYFRATSWRDVIVVAVGFVAAIFGPLAMYEKSRRQFVDGMPAATKSE